VAGDVVRRWLDWVTVGEVFDTGEREPVYNVMVDEWHTYFVDGFEGDAVWVHNRGKECRVRKSGKGGKKAPHANKVDGRPATLYKKYDKDGNFEKHGITHHEDPTKRYIKKEFDGGKVIPQERGPRNQMIPKERGLVETDPGPKNREPWAGIQPNYEI
jgi:hypothetical protein